MVGTRTKGEGIHMGLLEGIVAGYFVKDESHRTLFAPLGNFGPLYTIGTEREAVRIKLILKVASVISAMSVAWLLVARSVLVALTIGVPTVAIITFGAAVGCAMRLPRADGAIRANHSNRVSELVGSIGIRSLTAGVIFFGLCTIVGTCHMATFGADGKNVSVALLGLVLSGIGLRGIALLRKAHRSVK
jgi:hypothetical protein